MAARSDSEKSDAFRSSVSTAKNAFLCASLHWNVLATQTRPGLVRLDERGALVGPRDDVVDQHPAVDEIDPPPFGRQRRAVERQILGAHTTVGTPASTNASRRISNSVHVGTFRQSTIAMVGGAAVPPHSR